MRTLEDSLDSYFEGYGGGGLIVVCLGFRYESRIGNLGSVGWGIHAL